MGTLEEFAAECKATSRNMRRLPAELRRALAQRTKPEVAEPLADRIRAATTGPHARALSGAVKTRAQADPQIVIGGSRRVVSGGANARQLVYGNEFGGGSRVARVPAGNGHRGYRRRSTRQFAGRRHPFVFGTIARNVDWALDRFATIVDDVLKGVDRG